MKQSINNKHLTSGKNGVFEIVTGKNEREKPIFSVIVKRSYRIQSNGQLSRCETDNELINIDQYYDNGDPDWATVKYENELAPYKPSVDLVVIGKAYAPEGSPVESMPIEVQVGRRSKQLVVFGDRECRFQDNRDPDFTEPIPFTEMEIRYENAYGGQDEVSDVDLPFHYPRNNLGKGVVLRNCKEAVEGLPLPNIEDPDDLLSPERLIIGEAERWYLQPIPQGFGWRQRTWYPRSALLGSYPAFTQVGTITPEEEMGLLPENHIALAKQFRLPTFESHFNNGASLGLIFQELAADEDVVLKGLSMDGQMAFSLPGETPIITLDIGVGEQQLSSRLQTVSIRPDEREVDIIWCGTQLYEGYSWWPKMQRLHAEVQ
ncbi:MAG: DUF2169 domain-containing protein [Candidatus Thiodiazotropha sp.]